MPVGRSRQGTNQEGALIPQRSAWGQALEAGLPRIIENPIPIGTRKDINFFGGTIGGISTISASVVALIGANGYFGDVPQDQQDIVHALPPWERV
jgi:hypothetical protein